MKLRILKKIPKKIPENTKEISGKILEIAKKVKFITIH